MDTQNTNGTQGKLIAFSVAQGMAQKLKGSDWKPAPSAIEQGAETSQDYHINGVLVPAGTFVIPQRASKDGQLLKVQILTVPGLLRTMWYPVPAALIPIRVASRNTTQNTARVLTPTEDAMLKAARAMGPGSFPTASKNINKPTLTQKEATPEEVHAMYPGMTQKGFAEWLLLVHAHRDAMIQDVKAALDSGTDVAPALRAYLSASNTERLYASMASGAGITNDGYTRPSDEAIKAAIGSKTPLVDAILAGTATVPQETVPQETVPQETVPQETVPQETVPQETVPVPIVETENGDVAGLINRKRKVLASH